jgi:hypothetical protein
MKKTFPIPAVSCDACGGELGATVSTEPPLLEVRCRSCGAPLELDVAASQVLDQGQQSARRTAKAVARSLVELRRTLPTNRDELARAIRDPRHPFTAALLAGMVLVVMEMSGFGIFLVVAWILSNLILNPLGWVLIPVVVAVALAYRRVFARESFHRIRDQLTELQRRRDSGELSDEEHAQAREEVVAHAFGAAALEDVLRRGDFAPEWIERIRDTSQSSNANPEWIWDNEHLEALRKALSDATSQIYIYSGWLNVDVIETLDHDLRTAIRRGVRVYVGYGWESPSGGQSPSHRELRALDHLHRISVTTHQHRNPLIRRFPNHSKLLVCDEAYVICGSANWLSNSGYHNREVSVRLHDAKLVKELLDNAIADFAEPPEGAA